MPSARRATWWHSVRWSWSGDFYPRPPRGGRLNTYEQRLAATGFLSTPSARRATATATSLGYSVEISIHALREEGDSSMVAVITRRVLFLSTPSARRATPTIFPYWDCRAISIHALREEGDSAFYIKSTDASDFYPRPPRGGRPDAFFHGVGVQRFLSTPSARRATITDRAVRYLQTISIHALREEGDVCAIYDISELISFLSTPSARRATERSGPQEAQEAISIHALREEGDLRRQHRRPAGLKISIHALREEGDAEFAVLHQVTEISIHALREEGDFFNK